MCDSMLYNYVEIVVGYDRIPYIKSTEAESDFVFGDAI